MKQLQKPIAHGAPLPDFNGKPSDVVTSDFPFFAEADRDDLRERLIALYYEYEASVLDADRAKKRYQYLMRNVKKVLDGEFMDWNKSGSASEG